MLALTLVSFLVSPLFSQEEPECKTFSEIYGNGEALCNTLFGEAFIYTLDNGSDMTYSMWFFDTTNPNNEVTVNLGKTPTNTCLLNYFHKDEATLEESDNFTECHPWKEAACCHYNTVASVNTINEAYGAEFHWDRCGPLSQACERFFVQEACFYECDPNVGLYRRYNSSIFDENNPLHNEWEVYKMPISSLYCDQWYLACKNDLFCSADDGNFFSCANIYSEIDSNKNSNNNNKANIGLIVGITIACIIVLILFIFICVIRKKERKGEHFFQPINYDRTKSTEMAN